MDPQRQERRKISVSFLRVFRLEVILVTGLFFIVGGVLRAILQASSGVGPLTEVNAVVVKELLDNLKIMLGALISWGTMIISGFAKDKK